VLLLHICNQGQQYLEGIPMFIYDTTQIHNGDGNLVEEALREWWCFGHNDITHVEEGDQ